jgi:hypothetical protein
MASVSKTWGTSPEERRLTFPCDTTLDEPVAALYRAVTVNAPAEVIFRWLCQMRVAPYSYDWIDNGGQESPQQLTAGLDELAVGQEVMRIFELLSFERDRHFTIRTKAGSSAANTFGDIAVSYLIIPHSPNACRLLVKLIARYPRGLRGWLTGAILPWGDLIMMRRQLLNLKDLTEKSFNERGNLTV